MPLLLHLMPLLFLLLCAHLSSCASTTSFQAKDSEEILNLPTSYSYSYVSTPPSSSSTLFALQHDNDKDLMVRIHKTRRKERLEVLIAWTLTWVESSFMDTSIVDRGTHHITIAHTHDGKPWRRHYAFKTGLIHDYIIEISAPPQVMDKHQDSWSTIVKGLDTTLTFATRNTPPGLGESNLEPLGLKLAPSVALHPRLKGATFKRFDTHSVHIQLPHLAMFGTILCNTLPYASTVDDLKEPFLLHTLLHKNTKPQKVETKNHGLKILHKENPKSSIVPMTHMHRMWLVSPLKVCQLTISTPSELFAHHAQLMHTLVDGITLK